MSQFDSNFYVKMTPFFQSTAFSGKKLGNFSHMRLGADNTNGNVDIIIKASLHSEVCEQTQYFYGKKWVWREKFKLIDS